VYRKRAVIKAIATYLPKSLLTNEHLSEEFGDWDAQKIYDKTGIATRHIAGESECASDLAVAAAKRLFDKQTCSPGKIDFLLFCTESPDYLIPPSSPIIHEKLELQENCGVLDYNHGCSGFIYGLALSKSLIESGLSANILLLTGETYSKYINPKDKSTRTLFGDGAAAMLISSEPSEQEMLGSFLFGTDGSGAGQLIVPAGGMRHRSRVETGLEKEPADGNWRSEHNLYMNGPDIFNFTLKVVPKAVKVVLDKSGMRIEDVDYFIFHQANKFILEHLRRKIGIPEDKFYLCMEDCGNTVSSTIPIAMEDALKQNKIKSGDKLMLVAFGVGLTWAACLVNL
jgi:3-oxoacyl-[acyl-carrier-protein] synthase-3